MAIQSEIYSGTALDSRTFPSTKHIATKQHMAIWVQQVSDDVWVQKSIDDYQLINNSCVLNQLISTSLYKQLEVRIADEPNELTTALSDISTVSTISEEVVTVAGISTDVVTLAGIQTEIQSLYADKVTLDSLFADKATLDSLHADKATLDSLYADKAKLDSIFADKATLDSIFADKTQFDAIYADLANILAASGYATSAQLKAWEAEAEKMTADSYATEAEDVFVKTYASDGDGTFTASDTTEYSSLHHAAKSANNSLGAATNISVSTVQFADGNLSTADTDVQKALETIDDLSITNDVAKNVITQGNIAIDTTAITQNFAADTYTGNGTTQDIVTGINSTDLTAGDYDADGRVILHDRGVDPDCTIRVDGVIAESGSAVINTSKVHIKNRDDALGYNNIIDGIRGVGQILYTNDTSAEGNYGELSEFNINGFTVNGNKNSNTNLDNFISYQTLYTHIKWGLTSQGKRYVEAYNPVTREGMIMYIGSGLAGHQIPHSMGVELDYWEIKDLTAANWWLNGSSSLANEEFFQLNSDGPIGTSADVSWNNNMNTLDVGKSISANATDDTYIMYYKCKSETFTNGVYGGTGAAGNFIETKDVNGVASKPARVILKAISGTGDWNLMDNLRDDKYLFINSSAAEASADVIDILSNGFNINTTGSGSNGTGIQYYYEVYFDTNSDGGGSYFDMPTDDTNLNLTLALANYTDGKDDNGFTRSIERVTGTIDFAGVSDGFKWVAKTEAGSYSFYDKKPSVGMYDKESADDNRLVFIDGKYHATSGGELVTNGTFDTDLTGWTLNSIPVWSNGSCDMFDGTASAGTIEQTINVEIGKEYIVYFYAPDYQYTQIDFGSVTLGDWSSGGAYSSDGFYSFIAEDDGDIIFKIHQYITDGWIDNISVYKLQPTLGSALTTPISFIPNAVMVQSETPMYLDYNQELFENVMEDLEVGSLKVNGGFDLGQKWVDVTSERALGVEEINDTGKPINIGVTTYNSLFTAVLNIYVNGVSIKKYQIGANHYIVASVSINDGDTYYIDWSSGASTLTSWFENK